MQGSSPRPWLKVLILCAVGYLVIGVGTSVLAGAASSHQLVVAWRLATWVASAVLFGVHINAERSRPGSRPTVVAWRVSSAVALGAAALAAAALARAVVTGQGKPLLLVIALVAWPVLTGVPAFLVALAGAAVLARRREPL
jgi:hypothetical protein